MYLHVTTGPPGLRDVYTSFETQAFKDKPSRFTFSCLTTTHRRDYEVMDFIFHSPSLRPVCLLQMDRSAVLRGRNSIPHAEFPSDHVNLACTFELVPSRARDARAAHPATDASLKPIPADLATLTYMGRDFPTTPALLQSLDTALAQNRTAKFISQELKRLEPGSFFFVQDTIGDAADQHGGCWGAERRSVFFRHGDKSCMVLKVLSFPAPVDPPPPACEHRWSDGTELCFMGAQFPRTRAVLDVLDAGLSCGEPAKVLSQKLARLGHGRFFVQLTTGDAARQHGCCWGAESRSAFFQHGAMSCMLINFQS